MRHSSSLRLGRNVRALLHSSFAPVSFALASLVFAVAALAATLDIREWPVPEWPVPWKNTRPSDPAVEAKGRVWFVGQEGDYLGWLDVASPMGMNDAETIHKREMTVSTPVAISNALMMIVASFRLMACNDAAISGTVQ